MFEFGLTKYEKMADGKGSFWAAGFQDDLNKDVSITTALCLNLDWQNMKKWQMVKAPSELLVSKMISIKMYQSLPPYVWILDWHMKKWPGHHGIQHHPGSLAFVPCPVRRFSWMPASILSFKTGRTFFLREDPKCCVASWSMLDSSNVEWSSIETSQVGIGKVVSASAKAFCAIGSWILSKSHRNFLTADWSTMIPASSQIAGQWSRCPKPPSKSHHTWDLTQILNIDLLRRT